jgi:hypothetical protein
VLIGSAPFTEEYASAVLDTRLARLGEAEACEARAALECIRQGDDVPAMQKIGRLFNKVDSVEPIDINSRDLDPHPAEGVRGPLAGILTDFRFVLLDRCGHTPWRERNAREEFFLALHAELD